MSRYTIDGYPADSHSRIGYYTLQPLAELPLIEVEELSFVQPAVGLPPVPSADVAGMLLTDSELANLVWEG